KARNLPDASDLLAQLRDASRGAPDGGSEQGTEPEPGTARPMSGDEMLTLFRDAKDDVDAGLNNLRGALLDTGDEDMARIAEFGLYGMTEGGGVGMMKALFDLRNAGPDTRDSLAKAARDAAAAYKQAIFTDKSVDL